MAWHGMAKINAVLPDVRLIFVLVPFKLHDKYACMITCTERR